MQAPASFLLVPLAGEAARAVVRAGFALPREDPGPVQPGGRTIFGGPRPIAGLAIPEEEGRAADRATYGSRIYARAATAAVRIEGPQRPVDLVI